MLEVKARTGFRSSQRCNWTISRLKDQVRSVVPTARHISFINPGGFLERRERFLLGSIRDEQWSTRGFLKLTRDCEDSGGELRREAKATKLASYLGIPSTAVFQDHVLTSDGFGLVVFEYVDNRTHRLFYSKSQLRNVRPYIGRAAAMAYSAFALREVPADEDSSFLIRDDPRNTSADSFFSLWETLLHTFSRRISSGHRLNSNQGQLQKINNEAIKHMRGGVEEADNGGAEHFTHNDFAPTNVGFPVRRSGANAYTKILDYEHAGAVRNPLLALITDVSDFYRSCGVNNALRMGFILQLLKELSRKGHDESKPLLTTAMIFGTMLHCGTEKSDRLHPSHHEHDEAVDLLSSLQENIRCTEKFQI